MNDRLRFRIPVLEDDGKFLAFHFFDALKGVDYSDIGPWRIGKEEQCTGLRDKNGCLIYEGDVVKVSGDVMTIPIDYEESKAVINWDEDGFFLHFESGEIERLFQECWEYEVVGNIHKNPELLEDNNDVH